ncbi:MAG: hypothetical protein HY657_02320 [Acidobacteria bacterium]|nr:hypothetical protein [Acidobacteriota bacterium]
MSDCSAALAAGACAAAVQMCLGEEQLTLAESAPAASAERTRALRTSAEHYARAEALAPNTELRVRALDALTRVYDAQHLNELPNVEAALRELAGLEPDNLDRLYRLARVQEDQGSIDAAEETLRSARFRQPDAIDPYRMLAQFYARRATALSTSQGASPLDIPAEPLGWLPVSLAALRAARTAMRSGGTSTKFAFRAA